jgi:hypothetical protein
LRNNVRKIISGGQTGADRAAFDFAIKNAIDYGGYVPKGRLAEDGRIDERYQGLIETESEDSDERTELNVLHSDATLIMTYGELRGGSKKTFDFTREHQKPVLHVDLLNEDVDRAAATIITWLSEMGCATLNIAGPRASEDPHIYSVVTELLERVFSE